MKRSKIIKKRKKQEFKSLGFLLVIIVLLITVALAFLLKEEEEISPELSEASMANSNGLYGYYSHPNFWAVENYSWTAKEYVGFNRNDGIQYRWGFSGPYKENQRQIIYQNYLTRDVPGDIVEWEPWTAEDIDSRKIAIKYRYGGAYENGAYPYYSTSSLNPYAPQDNIPAPEYYTSNMNCKSDITGIQWPDVQEEGITSVTPVGRKYNDTCGKFWDGNEGGYIAVYLKESWPDGYVRYTNCDNYLPKNSIANKICKISPNSGKVYQMYLVQKEDGNYSTGCEAVIYAWGYPDDTNINYRDWFRNGELRYTDYYTINNKKSVSPYNHEFWDSACEKAFEEKGSWIYTGKYKLNQEEFEDTGTR